VTAAVCPTSLREAVERLAENPSLVPIAGCTDLMVAAPEREQPVVLDLLGVPELGGIRERDGYLEIGATTTFSAIRASAAVRSGFPALADAAGQVGGWQIQNRATIGGNIANASPAGDSLPVLAALDARVVLVGAGGERELAFTAFQTGYRETALLPGELIGWIRLPHPPPETRQVFRKVGTRRAQAISKVVVALVGAVRAGHVADYRLAAGSVAPTTVRLRTVEEAVLGRPFDEALAARAGRLAAAAVEPIDDVRSTAAYRRFALAGVVEWATRSLVG
jgi:CO/xanthine dehydrogenase FAD-binding subunit